MNRIVEVRLHNFQGHVETTVKFGDINGIVGPTDAGKSAIVRAIEYCLFNKPSGAQWFYLGTKHMWVTVVMSNGYAITRGRRGSSNYYKLEAPDGSLEEYKGFGTSVPLEIQAAHGMKPLLVNGKSQVINIAKQLDPAFLGGTDGGRAKLIGVVNNVNKYDEGLQLINQDILSINKKVRVVDAEISRTQILLDKIDISSIDEAITLVNGIIRELEDATTTYTSLATIYNTAVVVRKDIEDMNNIVSNEATIIEMLNLVDNLRFEADKFDNLNNIKKNISEVNEVICNYSALVSKEGLIQASLDTLADLEAKQKEYKDLEVILELENEINNGIKATLVDVEPLLKTVAHLEEETNVYYKLSTIAKDINEVNKGIALAQENIQVSEERVAQLKLDYSTELNNAGICPVCGGKEFNLDNIL